MEDKKEFKIHRRKDFTVMSNEHLRRKDMSLKAIGLLSKILSLPPTWDYSKKGLVAICKDGAGAVDTALRELQKFGYLRIEKIMPNDENPRIHYVWHIYENSQGGSFQGLEKQEVEKQEVENYTQLNTKQLNIKKSNTKQYKRFVKPSLEDVQNEIIEKGYNLNAIDFIDYYESNGWKVGRNPMKDWKRTLSRWNRKSWNNQSNDNKRLQSELDYDVYNGAYNEDIIDKIMSD